MVALAPLAFAQTQTYTYSYAGLPLPIYPDDWDTAAVAAILVPRGLLISNVTASVQVQFSGVGNLNVFLWSAEGTRSKLLERNCGGLQNIDTTFDDNAPSRYSEFCPSEPGRGPFRGNEPLANARNQNAFGYWKLAVENNGNDSTGYLTGFSITITGTPLGPPAIGPNTIVSTASLASGSVAPGEQLALFGVNLGPAGGVRAGAGANLPTNLGQTSVSFDGIPAPLFFAGDRLVAAQVPTNLIPGSTTNIQVVSASGASRVVSLPVVPSKPAIFTHEAGGNGLAKAINQDGSTNGDGSLNSSDRPAPQGSVIQVFASGLGPVDPPIPQGTPAPVSPLSVATMPISANIGGRAAVVTYAGAAPGQVGVYQVNIAVPALTPSGANSLVLIAGGNPSQSGVFIQVR
jgi:uncharacterized protein (TIGR03437 family)